MSQNRRFSCPRITTQRSRAYGLFRRLSLLPAIMAVVGFLPARVVADMPPNYPPGDQTYIYENGVAVNETSTLYFIGGHTYYGSGIEIVLNYTNNTVYDTQSNVVGFLLNKNE